MSTLTSEMLSLEKSALAWWKNKRPVDWKESQHLANPTVNCVGSEEKVLRDNDTRRWKCDTCGSVGFEPSFLPHQCTFCDGTEGGDPPLMSGTVEATVRVLAK